MSLFSKIAISLAFASLVSAAPAHIGHTVYAVEDRDVQAGSLSTRDPLNNAANLGAAVFAVTAIYNGLKGNSYFKEAEEFKTKYGEMIDTDSLAPLDGTSDLQARGKIDYAWLAGGLISAFNAIRTPRTRDLKEKIPTARDVDNFDLLG